MHDPKKLQMIRASIRLAEKSSGTAFLARIQSSSEEASRLMRRSYLQTLGALRLQKWAGVLS